MKQVKIIFLIGFFVSLNNFTYSQKKWSVKKVLEQSLKTHGGNWQKIPCLEITANGKHFSNSHLQNPNKLWEYDYAMRITLVENTERLIHYQKFSKPDTSPKDFTSIYYQGKEFTVATNNTITATHADNNKEAVARVMKLTPHLVVQHLLDNLDELKVSLKDSLPNDFVVSFDDWDYAHWNLVLSKKSGQLARLERKYYDHFYGDVTLFYEWSDYVKFEGGLFPQKVIIGDLGFIQYEYRQQISSKPVDKLLELTHAKATEKPNPAPDKYFITKDSILLQQVSPGIYSIYLPETNNRLLLAEFDKFLILLEGSYHSRNGDIVLEFIKDRFKEKPVQYWSFSHCHGQYIGFARSIAAIGGSIVTSGENAKFVSRLCEAPHSLMPDGLQKNPASPKIEVLKNGKWSIEDTSNKLEVYNVGPNHTDDYLVFYFPEQKLLFVGDLCWVADSQEPPKLSGRTKKFYESIANELKLEVESVYISWPITGDNLKTVVPFDYLSKCYQLSMSR